MALGLCNYTKQTGIYIINTRYSFNSESSTYTTFTYMWLEIGIFIN